MTPRVVVTDYSFPELTYERDMATELGAELIVGDGVTAEEDVAKLTAGADVVLLAYAQITDTVLRGLAPGATVIRYGIGFDTVDLDAARRHSVRVCNVPDYGADTVADHTVMLTLSSIRRVQDYHQALTANENGWAHPTDYGPIPALSDVTFGLVGTGQIGQKVAERLRGFGTEVIAYDPYADPSVVAAAGIELVTFDDLLATSDVISAHAPLTPETRHILNAEAITAMKDTAILVNTARGGLIDTTAAADAVTQGHLGGLAFDVFEDEPLTAGHPLRTAPRTLLTPHTAFYSERSLDNLQRLAAEEMARACRGEDLRCPIA